MTVSRDDLPAALVAELEMFDCETARDFGRKPVLPAAETPDVLVAAAEVLSSELERCIALGSRAAAEVDRLLRPVLDAVLRHEVVEPIKDLPFITHLHVTDFYDFRELAEADAYFRHLLSGRDNSTPFRMERYRTGMVLRRKKAAAAHGLELELTDEQWWEL